MQNLDMFANRRWVLQLEVRTRNKWRLVSFETKVPPLCSSLHWARLRPPVHLLVEREYQYNPVGISGAYLGSFQLLGVCSEGV